LQCYSNNSSFITILDYNILCKCNIHNFQISDICQSFILVMNIINKNDTFNNCKFLITKTVDKFLKNNLLTRHKRYDHRPFIYTINIINPLVKSMLYNYQLRKGDYIINQLYALTREQIEEYAHIYKVNIYIHIKLFMIYLRDVEPPHVSFVLHVYDIYIYTLYYFF